MKNWVEIGEKETFERNLVIVEEQVKIYELELERIEKRKSKRMEEYQKELNKNKNTKLFISARI